MVHHKPSPRELHYPEALMEGDLILQVKLIFYSNNSIGRIRKQNKSLVTQCILIFAVH
jgi:hypothetical protein